MNTDQNFSDRLRARWEGGCHVCVTLNPLREYLGYDVEHIPHPEGVFNMKIIDATANVALAYRLGLPYYQLLGDIGIKTLVQTVEYAREISPDALVILDAQWAGNSDFLKLDAIMAEAWNVDAVTVQPYMRKVSLKPFLDNTNRGLLVQCYSQDQISDFSPALSLPSLELAQMVSEWNRSRGNCGLILHDPTLGFLQKVRETAPTAPILFSENTSALINRSVGAAMGKDRSGLVIPDFGIIDYLSKNIVRDAAARAQKINLEIAETFGSVPA